MKIYSLSFFCILARLCQKLNLKKGQGDFGLRIFGMFLLIACGIHLNVYNKVIILYQIKNEFYRNTCKL